jgi:uncharacterized protein (TIGR00369 family)
MPAASTESSARTDDPLNPREMSGLEFVQAMVDGKFPHPSMADTIPMRAVDAGRGYVKFLVRADSRNLNPLGGVHGGFAATVLDSVTGCAVHTLLEAGSGYSTVDLNVKMLRAIPRDQELTAEGRVLHMSRSLGVSEGPLRDGAGTLLAHATCTCAILRSKRSLPSLTAASAADRNSSDRALRHA